MRRRRVLLVSYHFPPVGGAGVQRPAKFARYLPEFGWDVTVLACANPTAPVRDESLVAPPPEGSHLLLARSLEPSRLAQVASGRSETSHSGPWHHLFRRATAATARGILLPDPQVLWFPMARRAALRQLAAVPHDAVLVTAPPFSTLLLGASIARRASLPLLLDFRDEWDISQAHLEHAPRGAAARRLQAVMQRRVLRAAHTVIATSRASMTALADKATELGASPVAACVYNGWDSDDFASVPSATPAATSGKWRLTYTGTLWNLTDCSPLVAALRLVAEHRPELRDRIELRVVGRKTPDQEQKLRQLRVLGMQCHSEPYAPHEQAVRTMLASDALVLLLADLQEAGRVIPGKLFEYMASRRPILAITPPGETADLVRQVGGHWFAPTDVAGIADWIASRATSREPTSDGDVSAEAIAIYSRRAQVAHLVTLLENAAATGSLRRS